MTVEAIAAKRKSEIDRLKEEKREMEKLLTMRKADKRNTGGSNTPTKFGPKSGFGDIANLDISPKVRLSSHECLSSCGWLLSVHLRHCSGSQSGGKGPHR